MRFFNSGGLVVCVYVGKCGLPGSSFEAIYLVFRRVACWSRSSLIGIYCGILVVNCIYLCLGCVRKLDFGRENWQKYV